MSGKGSVKGRYLPVAAIWTVLVAGLLAGVPPLLAHRLPDPVASHWAASGVPDDSMPRALMALMPLLLWLVLAGAVLAVMIWGNTLERRRSRSAMCAALLGGGVYLLGLTAVTIQANLDRADWRQAGSVGPQVFYVSVIGALAAVVGWLAARPGPDKTFAGPSRPSLSRPLRRSQRAVWVSSLTVPWAIVLASAFLLAAVVLGALALARIDVEGGWTLVAICVLVGIVGLLVSTVRVQADRRGLAIAFGPLRRPVYRIPLKRIDSAWVETRMPSDVGGWGYRGLPGMATIMLRGGECLVVRYVSGGHLAVTIDDAERGAALLNNLINEHASDRS